MTECKGSNRERDRDQDKDNDKDRSQRSEPRDRDKERDKGRERSSPKLKHEDRDPSGRKNAAARANGMLLRRSFLQKKIYDGCSGNVLLEPVMRRCQARPWCMRLQRTSYLKTRTGRVILSFESSG